jgi:hypothetical protein
MGRITDDQTDKQGMKLVKVAHLDNYFTLLHYVPIQKLYTIQPEDPPDGVIYPNPSIDYVAPFKCLQIQGATLLDYTQNHKDHLVCVSDGSVLNGSCRHAWIITSGATEHITSPDK